MNSPSLFRHLQASLGLLMAVAAFCTPARGEDPPTYKTPGALLTAVNARMAAMKHAPFTMDELVVHLAQQASLEREDGKLKPKAQWLLETLIARKKFRFPVGLQTYGSDGIWLRPYEEPSANKLKLPSHSVLQVAIYNIPYGSKDAQGMRMKVTWETITIATALATKVGKK